MPSLMYLIFAKKQRITFFDPLGGRAGQNFFTLIILDSVNHWAPFSRASAKPVLAKTAVWFSFALLGAFLCRRYLAVFSPTNKMCFICSQWNFVWCYSMLLILIHWPLGYRALRHSFFVIVIKNGNRQFRLMHHWGRVYEDVGEWRDLET